MDNDADGENFDDCSGIVEGDDIGEDQEGKGGSERELGDEDNDVQNHSVSRRRGSWRTRTRLRRSSGLKGGVRGFLAGARKAAVMSAGGVHRAARMARSMSAVRRKQGHGSETAQCGDDGDDGEDGEDEQGLAMEAPIQQLCRRVAELRVWMHELAVESDGSAAQKASAADLVTKMELVVDDFEQRLRQLLQNAGEAATAAARAARQGAAYATAQVIAALDAIHEATGRLQREQREKEAAVRAAAATAAAQAAAAALSGSAAVLPLVAEADAVVAELVSRHEEEQRLKMALKHAVTVAKVAAAAASGSAIQARRAIKCGAATRLQCAARYRRARLQRKHRRDERIQSASICVQVAVRRRLAQIVLQSRYAQNRDRAIVSARRRRVSLAD